MFCASASCTMKRVANQWNFISWKMFTRFFLPLHSFATTFCIKSCPRHLFYVRSPHECKINYGTLHFYSAERVCVCVCTHIYTHIHAFSFYNSNGATRPIELLKRSFPDPYSFASSSVISHESTSR